MANNVRAMQTIVEQARKTKPTQAELAAIQREFDEHPQLWRAMGNLAHAAQTTMLAQIKPLPKVHAAALRMIDALRQELAQPADTPLEGLLIDQILLTWLDYHLMQIAAENEQTSGASLERLEVYDRLVSARSRRYLRAIETLARVRRLAVRTPLQINIGDKQVNVAGDVQVR